MKSSSPNFILKLFLSLLTAFIFILGCTPQFHIERASKHKEKAIKKGAVFTADTIKVNGDTTTITYFKDSIQYIETTITEYITLEGEVRYITKKDKRVDNRERKREAKREFRLRKQGIKAEVKKANRWHLFWFGVIVGSVIVILLKLLWNRYLRFFIRR